MRSVSEHIRRSFRDKSQGHTYSVERLLLLAVLLAATSVPLFSSEAYAAPVPDIEVIGNGQVIINEDMSPDLSDHTDFGDTPINSPLFRTFTITNNGSGDLNLTGDPIVQLSGSSTFTVIVQPSVSILTSSNSVEFVVQFLPNSLGQYNATVSIANDDSDENPYIFSIQGTGTGASAQEMAVLGNGIEIENGDATPDTSDDTDFGRTDIGTSTDKTFTIENKGDVALDLTGSPIVQLSGSGDFTVTSQPALDPVTPGGSTTFDIRFLPVSLGALSATVTIPNDDSDENPYTFSIKGAGVAAPPTLSNPIAGSIDTTSAVLGAEINSNGGDPIQEYGVYWDTTSPAESGTKCVKEYDDPGTVSYSGSCGSMPAGTKIYFRGYATNSVGAGYSPEVSFYTEPLQASDLQISAVTYQSMTLSWTNSASSDGAFVLMAPYAHDPTEPNDGASYYFSEELGVGEPIGNSFVMYSASGNSVTVTGLQPGTTYYVKVFAYAGSGSLINYQQDAPASGTETTPALQLTTSVNPPEAGSVNPDCTTGCMYSQDTQVLVTAYEYNYPFRTWFGCDQPSGRLTCNMIMDDDKSLTAEYESCMFPVLTAGTPTGFYGLQSGYNAAVEGDTIFADNSVFDGDFSVNASKSVFFEGGFDCVFDSAVGGTTIDGDMFVSGGKFTVDYGMLQVGLWVVTNDSCNDCHGQTQGPYRQITGPGGDFVKTSHHVSDGTSNEIVTNEDCIVCHAELSNDGLHANGYIELKDADDYVPASGGSGPLGIFTLGDGQGQPGTGSWSDDRDLTLFCLSCHDGDGASATFRPGGTALNPFNDWLANSHESGFLENPGPHSRLRVVDIYSLLDSLLTASHHNVLDYKYSVWEDGVDIEGIDDRAFTGTALINGDASEGSLLECADCHTTAENAHGAVNSRYFLKDKDGNDALGAGNTVICFRCHSESVYYDGDDAGFSIFPVHQGQLGNHDQDNDNIFGIGCLNCHGGNNFGAIHGALEDEEINNEGSGPYYTPYRFINGASFGYISNWDQQFDVSCGAKETTTFFSNCTNHSRDGGGQSYDRNYLRDLEY